MKLTEDERIVLMAMLVIGDDREILLDAYGDEDLAIDAITRLELRGLVCCDANLHEFFTSSGYEWLVASGQIERSLYTKSLLMRRTPYHWCLTVHGFSYYATGDEERSEQPEPPERT